MDVFTALILSTMKQAKSEIRQARIFTSQVVYFLKVAVLDEDHYQFEIFHVTYPDAKPAKGWGEPHVAENAHFAKEFTADEMEAFFETHFDVESWQPIEDQQ